MKDTEHAHYAVETYLRLIDLVSVSSSGKDNQYFEYLAGSNEGCYLTIGEKVYRLPVISGFNSCIAYSCAVSIYNSILMITYQ